MVTETPKWERDGLMFELAIVQQELITRLVTLDIEYRGGHLSPERYAKRVSEMLSETGPSLANVERRMRAANVEMGSKGAGDGTPSKT